jgi:hypothetical protein
VCLESLSEPTQSLPAHYSLAQFLLVLLLILAGAVASAGQTLKTGGTLEGTISDATGARISGVIVGLRPIETNQTRTVNSDDQGFFRATDLRRHLRGAHRGSWIRTLPAYVLISE